MDKNMFILETTIKGLSDEARKKILAHKKEIIKYLCLCGALDYSTLEDFTDCERYSNNVIAKVFEIAGIEIDVYSLTEESFENLVTDIEDIINFQCIDINDFEAPTIDEWKIITYENTGDNNEWENKVESFIESQFKHESFAELAEEYARKNLDSFYTWLMKNKEDYK